MGYIGNYSEEAQLNQWDIWGRKYTALGLIAYYDLSGIESFGCRLPGDRPFDDAGGTRKSEYRDDR